MRRLETRRNTLDSNTRTARDELLLRKEHYGEPEDIFDIFKAKETPFHKKVFYALRYLSVFKRSNGIFHKKKSNYVSTCSVLSSLILVGFNMIYIKHSIGKYNLEITINQL